MAILITIGDAAQSLFYILGAVVAIATAVYSFSNGYTFRFVRFHDPATDRWCKIGFSFRHKLTHEHHGVYRRVSEKNVIRENIHDLSHYLTVYGFFRDTKRLVDEDRIRIGKREYLIHGEHARSTSTRLWNLNIDENTITDLLTSVGIDELEYVRSRIKCSIDFTEFRSLLHDAQRYVAKQAEPPFLPQYPPRAVILINWNRRKDAFSNWFDTNKDNLASAITTTIKEHRRRISQPIKASD